MYAVRLSQPLKASLPIVLTVSGITIFLRPVQYQKAPSPTVLTDEGKTTFVSAVHSVNEHYRLR